ncbi:ATPase [Magnetovirga frankeli]|uniref:ATP-binding protein n=1 Tax=Magnetovirga frankeli TaxID=947516 RepID=UPI001292FA1D|nr:ATPase [gamma proteobacterium SS-5]
MNETEPEAPSPIRRFVAVVVTVLLLIAIPSVGILYQHQADALAERVLQEGRGVLDAYVAQTQDSIEKGQPRTFQQAINNIARLQSVLETALYSRYRLQTYRSGEQTQGVPFVRREAIPEGFQPYPKDKPLRRDWSQRDLTDAPAGKLHRQVIGERDCGECHYVLDKRLRFDQQGRAQLIESDKASFYQRLQVEEQCVACHTHWQVGEDAGYLGVTIETSRQQAEVSRSIWRVVYVLILIALVVLLATLIIGWMYARLDERNRELATKRGKIASLLDNSDQGFLSFDQGLRVDSEYSQECLDIFGQAPEGQDISGLLFPQDADKARDFGNNIQRILHEADANKRQLFLSLMPKELQIGDKTVRLDYRLLPQQRVMLVLSDVTRQKQLEQQVREEQGRLRLIVAAVREPEDFFELLDDYRRFDADELPPLLGQSQPDADRLAELYRRIHTFKGLFAQQEFIRLPSALHQLEGLIGQWRRGSSIEAGWQQRLRQAMAQSAQALDWDLGLVREALGEEFFQRRGELRLSPQQVRLLEDIAERLLRTDVADIRCGETRRMVAELRRLRHVDLRSLLASYPPLAERLAERLDKMIHPFVIEGEALRVPPGPYQPFIKALVHLFRNALDHGIEDPEERLAAGKDEMGRISCRLTRQGDELLLEVADDGRGIDLQALRQKALELGLFSPQQAAAASEQELLQVVFTDRLSTRSQVSDLSGRGIGLAALKAELDRLGGRVSIQTQPGQGTCFCFYLPWLDSPAA